MAPAILSLRRICKSFGPVRALVDVDVELRPGRVHALVGENGAGKSTLSKIIAGLQPADSGTMLLDAQPFQPRGRRDAEQQGIRIVTQELNLISTLSVAENIFFNDLPHWLGGIRYRRLRSATRQLLDQLGLDFIHPEDRVGHLTVGAQQLVEIAAGLSRRGRILILDEPTASLTARETELLFRQIELLKSRDVAIVYISHRMEELRQIADEVTILRDGRLVETQPMADLSTQQIVNRMVGRDLSHERLDRTLRPGTVAMRVEHLARGSRVADVSFEVHRGEILGFAGLVGSGRTETMRAIFGADPPERGRIYLDGSDRPARIRSPRDAVRQGIALLTENRKEEGLLLPWTVRGNSTLAAMRRVSRGGWIQGAHERREATELAQRLGVRCRDVEQSVAELSGGNQQKVVVAKWLFTDGRVLIFDEPTRGIDVGAKFELYQILAQLADRQKAVIMVSSDLKELMLVCDRIAVMSAGRLVATFRRGEFDEQSINAAAFSQYVSIPSPPQPSPHR